MGQPVEHLLQIDIVEFSESQPPSGVGDVREPDGDQTLGRDLFRAFLGSTFRCPHGPHAYRIPRLVRSS